MRRRPAVVLVSLLVLSTAVLALVPGPSGAVLASGRVASVGPTDSPSAPGGPSGQRHDSGSSPLHDPVAAPVRDATDATCAFPVHATDASGTAVTVDADPDRVVALQPSAAQTMWDVGARDEVVGMPVNQYTSDLDGYRRPTNVVAADGYTVDVETVVGLHPDLVLAPNVTPAKTVEQLRSAGLTVYYFREATTFEDVYAKTNLTGRLTGNCENATARVAWMQRRIGAVRRAVRDEPRPTVVYPLGGGVVAGSGTFLDELVTTAGGRNLAAEAGISGYGQLSPEVIVDRNPDWLVMNDGLPRSAIQLAAYNRTTAIRENQTVRVNANYANQPAPRIVYPIETIARALHPGAMADVNGTAGSSRSSTTSQPTAGAGSTTTPTGQPSSATSSGEPTTPSGTATTVESNAPGQPGFGVLLGLLALAATLVAVRPSA